MHRLPLSFAALVALSGCAGYGSPGVERADVSMRDAMGVELGTLTLVNGAGGLMLAGVVRGMAPGAHGIHLHTTGRCEPPFESAGGHWNPKDRMHGTQNPQGPHLGDMSNFTASSDGTATVSVMAAGGTLRGTDALLDADGAAVVIHQLADDYRTNPAGNSGSRIACGVVRGR